FVLQNPVIMWEPRWLSGVCRLSFENPVSNQTGFFVLQNTVIMWEPRWLSGVCCRINTKICGAAKIKHKYWLV
ncbi:hypothetical protein, partial [Flavobacterium aquidurense]|uniref:hypothetical protein n=1 Tax=Flavobacterium aquidurense TaxID=362413 RepID=UPI001A95F1C2